MNIGSFSVNPHEVEVYHNGHLLVHPAEGEVPLSAVPKSCREEGLNPDGLYVVIGNKKIFITEIFPREELEPKW